METKKVIKNYSEVYRKTLTATGMDAEDSDIISYERRLSEMYASDDFRRHSIYPTTDATNIYAV
jgi:hypothetical protein